MNNSGCAPHRVAVLALDGVYPFELGIPARILGAAEGHYDVRVCSADRGQVATNAGFSVMPEHGPDILEQADTVVVTPIEPTRLTRDLPAPVAAALSRIRPGTRIASICTGGFILAAAGLLDGRPATTHWECAPYFRRWYPHIRLDEGVLFVDDGAILTSAGAASGIDLCLHLIRTDHGSELANRAARRCVVPPFRDGGQAQYIDRPVPDDPASSTAATRQWALEHLDEPLTVPRLAEHAHMSLRTFARRFREETGLPRRQWIIKQRLDRARHLLESSNLTIDQIATDVGFATATSLRQHMSAELGVSPLAYRRTFQAAAATVRSHRAEAPA
ncbi:GlxA family transcriptional regulator [Streptomyces sp. NBC_00268]|uniref:GlxA family transcriptional regulator n=1 Tax=Streptomyces sp. NBC_00268 TaxID=2975695 RepID=UPI00225C16E5|nr:helix-turn-helix domain-containing protein [Streptomyces sp. NBC_00268]MCX5182902.1 helix-turn-helix domain-containing protein [Streptomyces sp. NBC_00268]